MKPLGLVFIALLAFAGPLPANPTTQPTADVLVVPFTSLSDPNAQPTLGRSIQQNLLADLARSRFHPAQQNDLLTDPLAAGRRAGVRYVISGNWQSSGDLLRFTGQIIDVESGLIVGGLNATGPLRDLFTLEDKLSSQAIRQLHQLTAPPNPVSPNVLDFLPPVTAPVHVYQGSDLQAYVNGYRTPSTDYWTQYHTSHDRENYGYNEAGYNGYYGYGYGYSVGYGLAYSGGFSYGYGFAGPACFPGRHLPLR